MAGSASRAKAILREVVRRASGDRSVERARRPGDHDRPADLSPLPDHYGVWIYVGKGDPAAPPELRLGDLRKLVKELER